MAREYTVRGNLDWNGSAAVTQGVAIDFAGTGSQGAERFFTAPQHSLGASPAAFETATKLAAVIFTFHSTVTFASDPAMAHSFAPIEMVAPANPMLTNPRFVGASQRVDHLELGGLISSIDAEPVEDGMCHPGESLLKALITRHSAQQLVAQVIQKAPSDAHAAAIFRLLGRVHEIDPATKQTVVTYGLASPSIEIRDAVVQAAETWEDRALAVLLRAHREPVRWLADYADRIVRELEG